MDSISYRNKLKSYLLGRRSQLMEKYNNGLDPGPYWRNVGAIRELDDTLKWITDKQPTTGESDE